MTEKDALRRSMIEARDRLSIQSRREMSEIINDRFLREWGNFESYGLYCSTRSEVSTSTLMRNLWKLNKTVLFPKVSGDRMIWGRCECEEDLCIGYQSIMEPVRADRDCHVDVLAVPCVAFAPDCHRLGYGKGFYDRFLASARCGLTVAFAYDCQLVPNVYPGGHDIAVDAVLTEKKIYRKNDNYSILSWR